MNALLEKGVIDELACGANFAYILNDNSQFLMTDYKVLQGQGISGFIKCMKMLHNGKTEIFYISGNFKTFASMLTSISTESFMTIVANLFNNIIEVKNNGFLSCQNIDISFDKIFIDANTLKVNLVYIPVSKKVFNDYSTFENELRTNLVKLINSLPSISNEKTMQLAMDLSNGMYSLEDIFNRIKGIKVTNVKPRFESDNKHANKIMRIVAMNAPTRVEIIVDKNEFILGKSAAMVDGAITFNKSISRVHCKVTNNGGQFMLTDLGSANGTYVNKVKLVPNQPHPIKNSDVIRLANSDFQIMIG
ncbi:hypothetical protein CFOLD11_40760 [Clostridium folliculivorans]|uniref:FHA domain-containing protein n=1 Tax=Clostridium folliculivorans TaxID=2886038 RepID=A0A9W5Y5S0_9CLOT|nr:FHA domain-containing protein [Clostridium folliculivorans]GKU27249.1 hypothetical protein CFOLD11_40760 [Clostridium folliculivorans]